MHLLLRLYSQVTDAFSVSWFCAQFSGCLCVLFGSMLFLNVTSSRPGNCFLSQSAFVVLFLSKAFFFTLRTGVIRKTAGSINVNQRLSQVLQAYRSDRKDHLAVILSWNTNAKSKMHCRATKLILTGIFYVTAAFKASIM